MVLLWGSNARDAHPIFFHHLLKGLDRGARMYAVDPRRTSSSKFADAWLGLRVGGRAAEEQQCEEEDVGRSHGSSLGGAGHSRG